MKKLTSVFLVVTILSGCATIIHGSRQDVSVSSTPSSATVYIDGQLVGETPRIVNLKRNQVHEVKILLKGYEPYKTYFIRKVDAWIAGNIVFGGLIGLAVDAITGSMYKLSPAQIQANLQDGSVNVKSVKDRIYFTVVLKPGKDWQYIGQLKQTPKPNPHSASALSQ